ncbi:MAG: hypothetical protein GF401_01820 [Chitinivibrionales bacterium]|nr:hypothetical protein [Chitinivibrionales bacterium]
MKKSAVILIIISSTALVFSQLFSSGDKRQQSKEKELNVLKSYLSTARDSLQNEIANRWRQKQRFVEQREADKEELGRLREKQERAHADLSRIKEEVFSKERIIEDEQKALQGEKDEWQFVHSTVGEVLEKEAEFIMETFPLDREERREDLEEIRRDRKTHSNPAKTVGEYVTYAERYLENGLQLSIEKETVVPDEGDAQLLTFARFGNVWAYGISENSRIYYIRQTGNLGAQRFAIPEIGESEIKGHLLQKMPQWIEQQSISGNVLTDVMQNAQTNVIISGKEVKATAHIVNYIKKGGATMVPLLLLPLWALVLIFMKLFQFHRKDKRNKKLSAQVLENLDKGAIEKAKSIAKNHKGVVARIVGTCLEHSKWKRSAAEKKVREILIEESPQLNKHLSTLGVIAGAAPLLGLLGTVTGMIHLFKVITDYGTGDPKILAGGISEALVTTQTGLAIAIPVLLVHNALRNRTNKIMSEMEKMAIRILNRLWPED